MYFMNYNSVKLTNYLQRFCIIPRVRNGVAEFTLLVQLVNNERTEVYDIGQEVDYTCVNAEDEKFLTLEILDKINIIIQ